jgi:serine/threonine-protein kinase
MSEPGQLDKGQSRWIWPFELTEQIGEGGMGVVYRARYVVNNREVAVKMLPADVTDKTALARFEREMAVLKDMRHPNIVRCFGGACEDKRRFYAMELVEGGTLEDVLQRRGKLSWEQVVEYALQMCAALDCSHQRGVIHRDVKPANFLIAANGQLKLSDFGLASVAAQRRITHAGKTAGTFLYMAPEQIRGGEVSPQTDLYALGCVLFELLTGRPPFAAETPAATLHLHCRQPPPRVSEFAMDCPPALEQLILRLLEKDAANRPSSAADVARELRAVTQTITVVPSRKPGRATPRGGNVPVTVPAPEDVTAFLPASSAPRHVMRVPPWIGAVVALPLMAAVWTWHQYAAQTERLNRSDQLWVAAMAQTDREVLATAAQALSQLAPENEAALNALVEAMGSTNTLTRQLAITALGDAGAVAQPYKSELLRLQKQDPEVSVRNAAETAIKKIDAAPALRGVTVVPIMVSVALAGLAAGFWWWQARRLRPSATPPA